MCISSFLNKMTMKWHFWCLHMCLISATMVNKSVSSENLVLKADFAKQKRNKYLLYLDFTVACDYFEVWTNFVIFNKLREFPRKSDLKEFSLPWFPVAAAVLCCWGFPLQWIVLYTGHLGMVWQQSVCCAKVTHQLHPYLFMYVCGFLRKITDWDF